MSTTFDFDGVLLFSARLTFLFGVEGEGIEPRCHSSYLAEKRSLVHWTWKLAESAVGGV